MITDYLDIANPQGEFTAEARYYRTCPISPEDGAELFNYEYVDPRSSAYARAFGNIQITSENTSIRTNTQLSFPNKNDGELGFVMLSDGGFYAVLQVGKDYGKANKQVLRLFPTPVSTQYLLRLVAIDNPWGVT